jgi:hypothetical protein
MISFSVKRSLEEAGDERKEEWVRGDIRMSSQSGTHLEVVTEIASTEKVDVLVKESVD